MTAEIIGYGEKPRKDPVVRICVGFILGLAFAAVSVSFLMSRFPPRWWLDRHQVSREIQLQDDPVATVLISEYAARRVYIPPGVEVSSGSDECIILTGPKDIISRLYRQAYQLDDPGWPFEWRTE